MKIIRHRAHRILLIFSGLFLVATMGINLFMVLRAQDCVVNHIGQLPAQEVALVLGVEPFRPDGSTNLHFLNRTSWAAEVYLSGKAKFLLLSGNQNNRGYNEVLEMQKQIISLRVPASAIELDFAGTRTWDSIRRASDVYHLRHILVITDAFHAPRAIFLCRHFGIEAVAYSPGKEPLGYWSLRSQVREYVARIKAVLDVLTRSENKNYG